MTRWTAGQLARWTLPPAAWVRDRTVDRIVLPAVCAQQSSGSLESFQLTRDPFIVDFDYQAVNCLPRTAAGSEFSARCRPYGSQSTSWMVSALPCLKSTLLSSLTTHSPLCYQSSAAHQWSGSTSAAMR